LIEKGNIMTVERIVRIIAGLFIMLSLALAHQSGAVNMTQPSWLWLTAFVGLNLFQSGLTRLCPLDFILKKAGVKSSCGI
jgi:hypothetical protein